MSFWSEANVDESIRYETPDGSNWVELRAEFKNDEVKSIWSAAAKDADGGNKANLERLATLAVKSWSNLDKAGKEVPFSIELYRALVVSAALWLDKTIMEHMQKVLGVEIAEDEGKPETTPTI